MSLCWAQSTSLSESGHFSHLENWVVANKRKYFEHPMTTVLPGSLILLFSEISPSCMVC